MIVFHGRQHDILFLLLDAQRLSVRGTNELLSRATKIVPQPWLFLLLLDLWRNILTSTSLGDDVEHMCLGSHVFLVLPRSKETTDIVRFLLNLDIVFELCGW